MRFPSNLETCVQSLWMTLGVASQAKRSRIAYIADDLKAVLEPIRVGVGTKAGEEEEEEEEEEVNKLNGLTDRSEERRGRPK